METIASTGLPGLLPDWKIRQLLTARGGKRLVIRPFTDYGVCQADEISYGLSSAGYDLRVGYKFMIFSNLGSVISPKRFDARHFATIEAKKGQPVLIPPNCFALAETIEYIQVPDDVLILPIAKSTYARTGIVMGLTPLEPGWRGKVTLEISNTAPLPSEIYAGEGIAQMLFFHLVARPEKTYAEKAHAKYQNQRGLTPPRVIHRRKGSSNGDGNL